jgi:hypothetical protein
MASGPDNHPFGSDGTGPDGSVRDGSGEDYRAMTPHRPGQPLPILDGLSSPRSTADGHDGPEPGRT